MKSALMPKTLPKLKSICPPPPKTLKLVIGARLGCTLMNEKPTGTSTLGVSCAQAVKPNNSVKSSREVFFIALSLHFTDPGPAQLSVQTKESCSLKDRESSLRF